MATKNGIKKLFKDSGVKCEFGTYGEFLGYKNVLSVTIIDCEGFDEDWEPIYIDYDIDNVIEILNQQCLKKIDDNHYLFKNFSVIIDYASEDI